MNYRELTALLRTHYPEGEAQAIARLVMSDRFGLTLTDLALGKDSHLSHIERAELENIAQKLASGTPVQQVLGHATFCGRSFEVTPDVLIPRPETEELVQWVLTELTSDNSTPERNSLTVADLGTGSGCIAISISLGMKEAFHARGIHAETWAADVSPEALAVARRNAVRLGADVQFRQLDMLDTETACAMLPILDCIVSNPPYVRQSESSGMAPHVLAHEPHIALFVPDADPLLFYRAIARIGLHRLRPGGRVFVEVNSALATPTADLFRHVGYSHVTLRHDQFGRPRMLCAQKANEDGLQTPRTVNNP